MKAIGRPKMKKNQKRKFITLRLPPKVIEELSKLPGTRTELILNAVRKQYKIKEV